MVGAGGGRAELASKFFIKPLLFLSGANGILATVPDFLLVRIGADDRHHAAGEIGVEGVVRGQGHMPPAFSYGRRILK